MTHTATLVAKARITMRVLDELRRLNRGMATNLAHHIRNEPTERAAEFGQRYSALFSRALTIAIDQIDVLLGVAGQQGGKVKDSPDAR